MLRTKNRIDAKIYHLREGELAKKSTNPFLGFQKKLWKILDDGTKIAYRNSKDDKYQQKNTLEIKWITVTELDEEEEFQLECEGRIIELRAESQQQKKEWMRALTQLKKSMLKQYRKSISKEKNGRISKMRKPKQPNKNGVTMLGVTMLTETTLPSISVGMSPESDRQNVRVSSALNNSMSSSLIKRRTDFNQVSAAQLSQELEIDIEDYYRKMPSTHSTYHILLMKLKVKADVMFSKTKQASYYMLFSSKSLFPDIHISEDNLINAQLPHWAQIDCFYKISNSNQSSNALSPGKNLNTSSLSKSSNRESPIRSNVTPSSNSKNKLLFEVRKIKEISQGQKYCSLKISVEGAVDFYEFYCDTLEDRKKLKQLLEVARSNAIQSNIKGKQYRKNYDALIALHQTNVEQFSNRVKELISYLIPNNHRFEPEVVRNIIDNFTPLINEVLTILKHKVTVPTPVIVSFLSLVHEQIKLHIKLTWDTSYGSMRGGDVLSILKKISTYEQLISEFVNDLELLEAMKELSKIYVRESYKNFQSIIINIVEQQKKHNVICTSQIQLEAEGRSKSSGANKIKQNNEHSQEEEDSEQYIETYGITDLFKFIYDVFDIALPCWDNKLHLHNINRLMQKSLQVFIVELKSAVDEEEIDCVQLIAIANNYFKVSKEIDEFYSSKFAQLKEKTKENYDKLKDDYREISMVILDKLSLTAKIQMKMHFEKRTFYLCPMEEVFTIVSKSQVSRNIDKMHFLFVKRYYERIFACMREEICKMLEKELKALGVSALAKDKTKDKTKGKQIYSAAVGRILSQMDKYRTDLSEIAQCLCKSKLRVHKQLDQAKSILSSKQPAVVKDIIRESSAIFKRIFTKLICLRSDFYQGSLLFILIQKESAQQVSANSSSRLLQIKSSDRTSRASFSKFYIQEFDRSSIGSMASSKQVKEQERAQENGADINDDKVKLICEGYVQRGKPKSKQTISYMLSNYDRIYLKLKNSILYIYENEKMGRCQNTINLEDVQGVNVPNTQKPSFVILHNTLNRVKQVKVKCDSISQRERWAYSIELQLKRISNDKKVQAKGVKIPIKKNKLIIDYQQLEKGFGYFSYGS